MATTPPHGARDDARDGARASDSTPPNSNTPPNLAAFLQAKRESVNAREAERAGKVVLPSEAVAGGLHRRIAHQALERGSHVDPEELREGRVTPDGRKVAREHWREQARRNTEWQLDERRRLEASKGDPTRYGAMASTAATEDATELATEDDLARFLATRPALGNANATDLQDKAARAQAYAQTLAQQLLDEQSAEDAPKQSPASHPRGEPALATEPGTRSRAKSASAWWTHHGSTRDLWTRDNVYDACAYVWDAQGEPMARGRDERADTLRHQLPQRSDRRGVPLAYLVTFTTHGTWLHDDDRGSADRENNQYGQPFVPPSQHLREYEARQSGDGVRLDAAQRTIVLGAILEVCQVRGWHALAVHIRSNHCHAVVVADAEPEKVLGDFKRLASRALNRADGERSVERDDAVSIEQAIGSGAARPGDDSPGSVSERTPDEQMLEQWRDAGTRMHQADHDRLSRLERDVHKGIAKPGRELFLPVNREDMAARGWEACDFVLVSGDAYVDHPSFANGVIGRVLEWAGYKVGIIAQPRWEDTTDIERFGRPRLGFLVSAGNLDSMLNAYTAHKLPRSDDPYSPGGNASARPNRATIVYCNLIRRAFGKVPIIIGGIEASQRRFSHYDYWEDKVRRSILLDSNADLCVFGMGETQIVEIAHRLNAGEPITKLNDVRGTAYVRKDIAFLDSPEYLARFGQPTHTLAHEALLPPKGEQPQRVQERQPSGTPPEYRRNYAVAFKRIFDEQDPVRGHPLIQACGALHVVQLPPARLQTEEELDRWYDLPYTRAYHPDYEKHGGIPAWNTTQHSIVTHRGCYGSCTFCAIWMHQGRTIQSRSADSIVKETEAITAMPGFKGYISDVGGPTANMYGSYCSVQQTLGGCKDRDCLLPDPCPALRQHLTKQLDMLSRVRAVPGVKKAFIASGIRYDMLIDSKTAGDKGDAYIDNLARHHTSGRIKVAPEHTSDAVLALMRKPSFKKYESFKDRFVDASRKAGKEQYVVSYFVSSHPGCSMDQQIGLAEYFKNENWSPEQVQDFIPTPMTPATAMFYSGYDPETLTLVYTPTTMREKRRQRALMQFKRPEFHGRVRQALREAGRKDLIGGGRAALVPPGPEEDWEDDNPRRPAGIGDGPSTGKRYGKRPRGPQHGKHKPRRRR